MPATPTQFAVLTRQSRNWADAQNQVRAAYRRWLRAAPEIQTMYQVRHPISTIRTRIRQEFERYRYVNKLPVVDMLIFKSNTDYQETMNFWRQTTHIMSYFKGESFLEDRKLPSNFMSGFLEGRN